MTGKWIKRLSMVLAAAVCFAVFSGCRTVSAAAEEKNTAPLLVLMYHQLLKSGKSDYIVTPDRFDKDLDLLEEKGFCSVTSQTVIDYVLYGGALPEKSVLITFDDGHYNNLYYGGEILKKHGFTALISVIGKFSENSTALGTGGHVSYSYLTWDEIRFMAGSDIFEFGNHTYDMHNYSPRFGVKQKAGESDEDYQRALKNDIGKLQRVFSEKCNVRCKVFAVPFGAYNNLTKSVLAEEGFLMMMTCNEGINSLQRGDSACLYRIKRYNRSPSLDLAKILEKYERLCR